MYINIHVVIVIWPDVWFFQSQKRGIKNCIFSRLLGEDDEESGASYFETGDILIGHFCGFIKNYRNPPNKFMVKSKNHGFRVDVPSKVPQRKIISDRLAMFEMAQPRNAITTTSSYMGILNGDCRRIRYYQRI